MGRGVIDSRFVIKFSLRIMPKGSICVDFDGVIHRYSRGWFGGSIYDPPVEGAREGLKHLTSKGFEIIIFTTRLNPEVNENIEFQKKELVRWLTKNGFRNGVH